MHMHLLVYIYIYIYDLAGRWPGGAGGGHGPSGVPFAGPFRRIQVSYKKFKHLFEVPSGSQAGREEEEVTTVYTCLFIDKRACLCINVCIFVCLLCVFCLFCARFVHIFVRFRCFLCVGAFSSRFSAMAFAFSARFVCICVCFLCDCYLFPMFSLRFLSDVL